MYTASLELLPLAAGILVAVLHWPQFLALFWPGRGAGTLDPAAEGSAAADRLLSLFVLVAAVLLELLPYAEELGED